MKTLIAAFLFAVATALPAVAQAPTPDLANRVYLELPAGRVVIRLRPDLAPNHVARVKALIAKHFYDGTPFHRVIAGFMAQGGDPTGTGTGGSGLGLLKAEFTNTPFVRGVIGAARSEDPNSADSQFYIMLGRAQWLDGKYTVWGEVTEGMEFVDAIKKGTGEDGLVSNPDRIKTMRMATDVK